jgi:hypothetical protein
VRVAAERGSEICCKCAHVSSTRTIDANRRLRVGAADEFLEPQKAFQLGSFYQALISGVLTQWLIDPTNAPTGRDMAEALRMIAASL